MTDGQRGTRHPKTETQQPGSAWCWEDMQEDRLHGGRKTCKNVENVKKKKKKEKKSTMLLYLQ